MTQLRCEVVVYQGGLILFELILFKPIMVGVIQHLKRGMIGL